MNPMNTNPPKTQATDRILRLALRANATFSGLTALISIVAPTSVATMIGVSSGFVLSLGVELGLFSAFLFFLSGRPTLDRPWIRGTVMAVIAADLLWVALSALAILGEASPLTTSGQWIVGIVALFVTDFAAFQAYGLYRLRRTPQAATIGREMSSPA